MNSHERLRQALAGEWADRRPFVPMLSLYGAGLSGAPVARYYQEPSCYAAGQAAIAAALEVDVLFSPLCFAAEGAAFGSELAYSDRTPPSIKTPAAAAAEDFMALPLPRVDAAPTLLYMREATAQVVARTGGRLPVGGVLLNPVDLPAVVMGLEAWLETIMFRRALLAPVLERATEHFVAWGRALMGSGASFLVVSGGLLNHLTMTRDLIEPLFLPALREAFGRLGAPIVMHDGGGTLLPLMDLYRELPHVAALFTAAGDDPALARRQAGDKALIGGLDGPTLYRLSEEEVFNRCEALLAARRADPRFLLGTPNTDVHLDVPLGHLRAMGRAIAAAGAVRHGP